MRQLKHHHRPLWIIFVGLLLAACSSQEKQENLTERELYDEVSRQLEKKDYPSAVRNLQLLEARYPFGPYAEQAQLELIYTYYRIFDFDAVIEAAERFIRLHPQHPNVDYAYYMRGLANYAQGKGIFERFLKTDVTERDPGRARQSFADFSQLISLFPNSDYTPDARARMIHLRNWLARYEINVANYYLKRRAFIAAANRGRFVVENFPQTPAVPDALAIMVQSYRILGMEELADSSLAVLAANYPDHPNLDQQGRFIPAYDEQGAKPSLLARASFGLFGRASPPQINHKKKYESAL